jgi:hypothetical protein
MAAEVSKEVTRLYYPMGPIALGVCRVTSLLKNPFGVWKQLTGTEIQFLCRLESRAHVGNAFAEFSSSPL